MKVRISDVRIVLAFAITASVLSGCAAYGGSVPGPYPPQHFDIPEGHMPPPGECRIWIPDLAPGQQSPPGNCYELERQVPRGAILVHG